MKKLIFLLITATTIFASCTKEGPTGPAGKDGNANVHSSTITTTNTSWTFNGFDWVCTGTDAQITADIASTGCVLAYLGDGSGTHWVALPLTYSLLQINFDYNTGAFSFDYGNSDGTDPGNPGGQQFKIVCISASQRHANPNVDLTNYTEVKKAFNLTD